MRLYLIHAEEPLTSKFQETSKQCFLLSQILFWMLDSILYVTCSFQVQCNLFCMLWVCYTLHYTLPLEFDDVVHQLWMNMFRKMLPNSTIFEAMCCSIEQTAAIHKQTIRISSIIPFTNIKDNTLQCSNESCCRIWWRTLINWNLQCCIHVPIDFTKISVKQYACTY